MSKEKKMQDVEERRVRKYILAVIIYTLVMVGIVLWGILSPKDNNTLPTREDVSWNFSSAAFM